MLLTISGRHTLAFALSFLSAAVCVQVRASDQATPIEKAVSLTLTSSKTRYFAQEPIVVNLRILNKSAKSVDFDDYKSLLEERVFTITDSAGHLVPLTAYGKELYAKIDRWSWYGGPSSGADLKQGQQAVYHVWLNRVFDLSLDGDYVITATKTIPEGFDQHIWEPHPITSNHLKITIGSPDVQPYSERIGPDFRSPSAKPNLIKGQYTLHF